MASLIGKSRPYALDDFVPESAHFSGCLLFHILSRISYEMTTICFLTIKSLMNIRSLDKSGRESVTCQVNTFSRLLPERIQDDITYQCRIMGFFLWFLLSFSCKKGNLLGFCAVSGKSTTLWRFR